MSARHSLNQRRRSSRIAIAAAVGAATVFGATHTRLASATTSVWNGSMTGNWSAGGDWIPAVVPTSGSGTDLLFSGGGYTATQDDATAFNLSSLRFTNTSAISLAPSGSNLIQFVPGTGYNPYLSDSASGNVTISAPVTWGNSTTGISAAITNTGSKALLFSGNQVYTLGSKLTFTNSGTGVIQFADGPTYTQTGTAGTTGDGVVLNLINNNTAASSFLFGNWGFNGSSAANGTTLNISGTGVVKFSGSTSGGLFGTYDTVNVLSGGSFDFAGNGENMGAISGAGTILCSTGTASLTLEEPGYFDFSGALDNAGSALEINATTLTQRLSGGSSTFTGTVTVAAGTLVVGANAPSGSAGALGNSTAAVLVGNTSGSSLATLVSDTSGVTIGRAITLQSGNTGTVTLGGTNTSGTVTFSGNVTMGTASAAAKALTVTAASGGTVIFSGNLLRASSATGTTDTLTKVGGGIVTLQGANTFTGATSINAGTLRLDFTVNNGSELSSTGLLTLGGGSLDVVSNASAPTSQAVNGLTLSAGSGRITLENSGASAATLSLGTITNTAGATVDFGLPTTGSITTTNANTAANAILGGWATVGQSNWAVISGGAIAAYSGATTTSFATGDQTVLASSPTALSSAATTTNSLQFTGPAAVTFAATTDTLTITTGGILVGSGVSGATSIGVAGSGTIVNGGNALIVQQDGSSTLTINSIISGTGSLIKAGAGTLTLAGANTYSGGTYINGGTLAITTAANLGTTTTNGLTLNGGTLSVPSGFSNTLTTPTIAFGPAGGTMQVASGTASFLTKELSGSGSLTKTGNGTLEFVTDSDSSFTGAVVVNAGLIYQSGAYLNSLITGLTIGSGAEFEYYDNGQNFSFGTKIPRIILNGTGPSGNGALYFVQQTSGTAALTGTITPEINLASSSSITISNNAQAFYPTITASGNITGPGSLTIGGTSTLCTFVVNSANNSYAGGTNISNVTLQTALGADRLPTGTTVTLGAGTASGILDLDSFSQTVGGLTTAGTGTSNAVINSSATATSVLTVNLVSGSQTFAGTLGGAGTNNNNLGFAKAGAGTLTLANTATNGNTFLGALTVSGGTLQFSADNNLGSVTSPNTIIVNGGTLEDLGTAAIAPSAHTFQVNDTGGALQVDGTAGAGTNLQISAGNLTGTGTLTKAGTSNLVLLGDNPNFTGAWIINNGFVEAQSNNALGTATATNTVTANSGGELVGNAANIANNIAITSGGALSANGNDTFSGNLTVSGAVSLIPSDYLDTTSRTMIISGPISNGGSAGAVTVTSTNNGNVGSGGTLILTGAGTYSGGTTISSGSTLQIGNGGTTGSITGNVSNSGTLAFNHTDTVTFPGIISGGGSVAQNGTGTLALTSSNTYTGGTAVTAGALQLTGGAIQASALTTISSGAKLNIVNAGATGTVSLLSASSSPLALTLGTLSTDTMTLNLGVGSSWNTTTPLLSVGTLTANGMTTINLTAAGASFSTQTYDLINYTSLVGSSGNFTLGTVSFGTGITGTLDFTNPGQIDLDVVGSSPVWTGANGGIWDINNTPSWQLGHSGIATTYSDGASVLFDDTAGTGNTSVTLNTTVTPNSVTFSNTLPYTVSGSGSIAGATTGVALTGTGTVTLATNNTYGGGTSIASGGTLQLGNGGTSGSVASNISNSGALIYDRSDTVIAGYNISGNGSVSQQGSGTVIVTGSWAHTGGTTVTNGILQIGNGGTAGSVRGAITGTGTLVLDRSDSVSYGNALSGALNVTVSPGAGPTTITNGINYSGSAAVTNNSGNTLNLGAMTYGTGVTTTYAGSGTITSSAVQNFANNASVAYTGSGTLSLGTTTGAGIAFGSGTVNITNGVSGGGSTGVLHLVDGGTYSGSGTVNLYNYNPAANSFTIGDMGGITGTLNIAAGVVIAANTGGDLFGNSLTLNVSSGAVFDFNTNGETMGAISGSGTIQGNAGVGPVITGTHTWAGNFTGTGAFTESTGVDYTFTGANTGTGLITVPASTTFAVGNGGATGSIVANISNAGAVTFNTSSNNTYPGVITGAGAVNVSGTGTTYLSGTSTYTGVTTVSNGTLQVAANATLRPYTVTNGAGMIFTNNAIASPFAISVLSVGGAGGSSSLTFQFNGGLPTGLSNPIVNVATTGGLTLNGSITVNVGGTSAFTTGQYPLISYSGVVQGAGYSALTLGTLPFRTNGVLVNDAANSSIDVSLTADGIKWNGNVPGANWNTTDANWVLDIEGTPTTYQEGGAGFTDTAVFDNTATGSYTVNIPGAVSPNGVNVNGSSYTFQGAGKISGGTGLSTSGTGTTLTILTNNDYSGGTVIGAGSTLQLGNGGTIGSVAGAISGAGTLILDRSDDMSFSNTLSGALNVTQNGTDTVTLTGTNSQTGGLTINAGTVVVTASANLGAVTNPILINGGTLSLPSGTLGTVSSAGHIITIGANGGTFNIASGISQSFSGNGFTGTGIFTKAGGGSLNIGTNSSAFNGQIIINGGVISETSNQLTSAANVTINAGGQFQINDNGAASYNFHSGSIVSFSGNGPNFGTNTTPGAFAETIQSDTGGAPVSTISNAITLAGDSRLGVYADSTYTGSTILSGSITGPGALIKDGPGTLTLTSAGNAYGTGTSLAGTIISEGLLQLGATNALSVGTIVQFGESNSGSTSSNNNSGTLDLAGFSQTVAGLTSQGTGTQKIINSSTTAVTLTVNDIAASPLTYGGRIGGGTSGNAISFVKDGTGTLILTGTQSYTGNTTILNGTLALGGSGSIPASSLNVTVSPGAVLDVSAVSGGLALSSAQTLLVGRTGVAANDVIGATTINGKLDIGGVGTVATATFSNNLTLNNATVKFDLSSPTSGDDLVAVGGNLTLSGTDVIAVNQIGGVLLAGSYPLFTYSGSLTGNAANLSLTGISAGTTRGTYTFDTTSTPGTVALSVSGSAANLTWVGSIGANNWDLITTANFSGGTVVPPGTTPDNRFYNGDAVTFDATGVGGTNAVNLVGTLAPSSVVVTGGQNYTFSGTGSITGGTGLTMNGTGTLTISTANNFTGTTAVNSGTLAFTTGGAVGGPLSISGGIVNLAVGAVPGAITVNSGILNTVTSNAIPGALTIGGGTVNGANGAFVGNIALNGGKLVYATATDTASATTLTFNGGMLQLPTVVYSTGSNVQPWVIGAGGATVDIPFGSPTIEFGATPTVDGKEGNAIFGAGSLTLTSASGHGVLSIGEALSTFTGTTTVMPGATLRFTSNQFSSAGSITVQNGATYMIYDTTSGPYNLGSGASLNLNGNGVSLQGTGVNGSNVGGAYMHVPDPGEGLSPSYAINIPIVLQSTSRITELDAGTARGYTGAGTTTDMFTKPISGPGTLIKDGDGVLIISNNSGTTPNSYAGTIVSNGLLKISNGGTTPATIAPGGTNILPPAAPLQLGEALLSNSGTVDLFGNSQTVTGLSTAGTGTANQVINSSSTAATLAVNYGGTTPQTFAGQIGGGTQVSPANNNIAVRVAGGGVFILAGAGTYSGNTAIQNGTLVLGTSPNSAGTTGSLNPTTAVMLGSGVNSGIFELGDASNPVNQTVTGLTTSGSGANNAVVGGNSATASILTVNNATPVAYSGTLGGTSATQNSLGLTVNGGSTLTLTGSNTYTGPTNITNGTVILGTRTGTTTGSLNPLTTLALGNGDSNSGILQLGDASNAVNQTIASLNSYSANSEIIGGNANAISTLTVASSGADLYLGNLGGIGTSANNLALTFSGIGSLTLDGNNTYAANTTITSGTLALATNLPSNIAASPNIIVGDTPAHGGAIFDVSGMSSGSGYHVVSGQTLSGFGSVNTGINAGGFAGSTGTTVNVDSGATIAPGSSTTAGTLTINGNTVLAAGGNYIWKLDPTGVSSPSQDQLMIGQDGALTIPDPAAGAGTFNLIISRFGQNPATSVSPGTTFIIAEAATVEVGSNITPVTGDVTSSFTVTESGLSADPGDNWSVSVQPDANFAGNGLYDVDLTAVTPEPGSLGLLGVAALGLLRRRRRNPNLSVAGFV